MDIKSLNKFSGFWDYTLKPSVLTATSRNRCKTSAGVSFAEYKLLYHCPLTIAGVPVMHSTDPVVAFTAGAVEPPGLGGCTDADATVTSAPPTADLAIRCPTAAQRRLCGQFTHATHLSTEKKKERKKGQFFHSFGDL